jgi:hypothetical protein
VRQPTVTRGPVHRFLPPLPHDPLTLLAERTDEKEGKTLTGTQRSLGALSILEIDGRAHVYNVSSSGSRQNHEGERFGE